MRFQNLSQISKIKMSKPPSIKTVGFLLHKCFLRQNDTRFTTPYHLLLLPKWKDVKVINSYVYDDVASEMLKIGNHISVLVGDLGVLDQFGEVLLGNT